MAATRRVLRGGSSSSGRRSSFDPPLVDLLAEVESRLEALGARYGPTLPPEKRFEVLDSALDDLDTALERVRGARGTLARIELRLPRNRTLRILDSAAESHYAWAAPLPPVEAQVGRGLAAETRGPLPGPSRAQKQPPEERGDAPSPSILPVGSRARVPVGKDAW